MPEIIYENISSGSRTALLEGDGTPIAQTSHSVPATSEVNEEKTTDIISKNLDRALQ